MRSLETPREEANIAAEAIPSMSQWDIIPIKTGHSPQKSDLLLIDKARIYVFHKDIAAKISYI